MLSEIFKLPPIVQSMLGSALYTIAIKALSETKHLGDASKIYKCLSDLQWKRLEDHLKEPVEQFRSQQSQEARIKIAETLQQILQNDEDLASGIQELLTSHQESLQTIINDGFSQLHEEVSEISDFLQSEVARDLSEIKGFLQTLVDSMPSPEVILEEYLDTVRDKHTHIDMIDRQLELKNVYVTLNLLEEVTPGEDSENNEVEVDNALATKRLVILGNPGAGKTTLLRHLTYTYADQYEEKRLVPIFVKLVDLADRRFDCDFDRWLNHSFTKQAVALIENLHDGQCLVFLDGLDESNREDWNSIRSEAERLADWGNQVILTCRETAYPKNFMPMSFQTYGIVGFNKEQQRRFIENFFHDAPEKGNGLLTALQSHERMRQIMETPLLLTLTAVLYDNSSLKLPIQRAELYQQATDFLMRRWNEIRTPGRGTQFDSEDKLDFLVKLAFESYEKNEAVFEHQDLLARIRQWQHTEKTLSEGSREELLDELSIHNGILSRQEDDSYRFLHPTFQEYFTAKYIVADSYQTQTLVANHFLDERWWEVFLLVAGSMEKGDDLLLEMDVAIRQQTRNLSTKVQDLLRWADEIIDYSSDRPKPYAKRAIAVFAGSEDAYEYNSGYADASAIANASAVASDIVDTDTYGYGYIRGISDVRIRVVAIVKFNTDEQHPFRIFDTDFAPLLEKLKILDEQIAQKLHEEENYLDVVAAWWDTVGLTDEMLSLSTEEWEALANYLKSTKLLIDCKNAAFRVTSKAWQSIEDRLLRVD